MDNLCEFILASRILIYTQIFNFFAYKRMTLYVKYLTSVFYTKMS